MRGRISQVLALVFVHSWALSGCGGGGATSPAPTPAPLKLPAIASFAPGNGAVGTNVILTGSNLTGATAVTFGSTAATFTVTNATQVTTTVPAGAATGKISVTTASGTASSASNFTVTPPAPAIASFAPSSGQVGTGVTLTGTGFTGATSVTFSGTAATFSVTDDSHIATSVPASATSGTISVATGGGSASSGSAFTVSAPSGLDLTVNGFYVTQATQNYPAHDVPLVQGRSGAVRVFVQANQANTAQPQVRVRFIQGTTTNTLTINAPGSSVPLGVDPENAGASWNAAVPAAWITPGTQVIVDVDPANAIAESNKGNNQATQNLDVRNLKQWKITLIPVKTADGRVGVVENASRDRNNLVDFAKRLWPVPDTVDVTVGAQLTSSASGLTSTGTGWNTVLSELLAKRTADNVTDRYYFGFVNVSYNSGVAGLGYVGAPAAIGWDYSSADAVLAHEEGHNFGRQHSPCGGASNPDLNYPYAGGLIGVPGWDAFATSGNLKTSADHTDVMAYCSNQWVSDYVYKSVLNFRASSPLGNVIAADVATNAAVTPKEGLLVWGRVEDGKLILEPAFRVAATGAAIEGGPFTWEGRDAAGHVIARVPFRAFDVEDLPFSTSKNFAFVVPLGGAALDAVEDLRVLKEGEEVARQHAATAAQAKAALARVRLQNLLGRAVQIDWDASVNPVLMLKDAQSGEVRGFLRGGHAELDDAPDALELHVSDGVRSKILLRNRPIAQ